MPYPFVNFGGIPLPKEWVDCGYSSKPSQIQAYGSTVATGINISSDDWNNPQVVHVKRFSSATPLTSWSLELTLKLDGSQEGKMTLLRAGRDDQINADSILQFDRGRLYFEHGIHATGRKMMLTKQLDQSAPSRIFTINIACNEQTGAIKMQVDGESQDELVSSTASYVGQTMGVAPAWLKLGNIDSTTTAPSRMNVILYDLKFSADTYQEANGNVSVATGIYAPTPLTVSNNPSSFTIDGELVIVTPTSEIAGVSTGEKYSYSKVKGTDGVIFTCPSAYMHGYEQGKVTFMKGSTQYNYKFLESSTRTGARVNYSTTGGNWNITSTSGTHNSVLLANSPSGGIEIKTVTIPTLTASLDIPHTLGDKPVAAIIIDSTGKKFFSSIKSDRSRPTEESYNPYESVMRRSYSPLAYETATGTNIRLLGRTEYIGNTSRYTDPIRNPDVHDVFVDKNGNCFAIFATQTPIHYGGIHYGQGADFETYEITSSGMTKRHRFTDANITEERKYVSILKDKSTGDIYMHVFCKYVGWRPDAIGKTHMLAYLWDATNKTWVSKSINKYVENRKWLSPTTSTDAADSSQLLYWREFDLAENSPNETIIGLAIWSRNPPSETTAPVLPPFGGGGSATNGSQAYADPMMTQKPRFDMDGTIQGFSPAGGDTNKVKVYLSSFRGLGLDSIPLPDGYAGGYNSYRISELELDYGQLGTNEYFEISMIPVVGTGEAVITVYMDRVNGTKVKAQQFWMTSSGQLLEMGTSGMAGSTILEANPGHQKMLDINGETWIFESSVTPTGASTGHGRLNAYKLVFVSSSNAPMRYRKELMGTYAITFGGGYVDAILYNSEAWVVFGCPNASGTGSMHIMRYDFAKNDFVQVQSIAARPYLNISGSARKMDISAWHRPRFLVSGSKMYLSVSTVTQFNAEEESDRQGTVFEYNATHGSFVNSYLMADCNHEIAAGTAKVILFTESSSVQIDDDLPLRSSVMRSTHDFKLTDMPVTWGNGFPHVALDSQVSSNTVIGKPCFNQKEIPAIHGCGESIQSMRSITYGDQVFCCAYNLKTKKALIGAYGHFTPGAEGEGVPFWYNASNTFHQRTFNQGTKMQLFPTGDTTDYEYPAIGFAVSNYSGSGGTIALGEVSTTSRVPVGVTELTGKSGNVVDFKPIRRRVANSIDDFVAVCFENKTTNAQIFFAGIDALLDGTSRGTGWSTFGGFAHPGGKTIAFDVAAHDRSSSTRFTCAAAVDVNGTLYYWVDLTTSSTTPINPSGTIAPGNYGTDQNGVTFDKAKDVKIFSDGTNTYMYVFVKRPDNPYEHPHGHAIQFKLNTSTWKFEKLGHLEEMHYSAMSDRPFKWNGEWYWYGSTISDEFLPYPIDYLEGEQTTAVFKYIPEKGSFTTSPLWSFETPIVVGIPRYNCTSEYRNQNHPMMWSYSIDQITSRQMGSNPLNTNGMVIDNTRGKGFYYRPGDYAIDYFGGVPYMVPDRGREAGANSAYGAGGNDMVLKIGAGSGFADPFRGFDTDYRWEQQPYPFIENWKTHYYPTPTAWVADTNGRDWESTLLVDGGTRGYADSFVGTNVPMSIVTPSIIPGRNRKQWDRLYVEAGWTGTTTSPELADALWVLEGANEGELVGYLRNSNLWLNGPGMEGTYPVDGTRRDYTAGIVFDYVTNIIQVYINGTYRAKLTLPEFDMRLRGQIRKRSTTLQQSSLYINFGQVPFKYPIKAGDRTISGATLGGTYPNNYTSKFFIGKTVAESVSSSSTTDVRLDNDADVIFLLSSSNTTGGACVVIKEEGYKYRFDLDGNSGRIDAGGNIITDLSNGFRINHNRWASGTFDLLALGLSAQPCYGVEVVTYTGNGITGERELPLELPRRPGAALVLPHRTGEYAYWVFYNEETDTHYAMRAGDNQGYTTTVPMDFIGKEDGRAKIVTRSSGLNFNTAGSKYTVVFFCDVPGLLNVRQRGNTLSGTHEAHSFDTNLVASIFTTSDSSSTYGGMWHYWATDLYSIEDPSDSTAAGGIFTTEGSVRFLRIRPAGTSQYNNKLSPARISEGVMLTGGWNNSGYPNHSNTTRSTMKYFGIFFGDGPLIYSPTSRK